MNRRLTSAVVIFIVCLYSIFSFSAEPNQIKRKLLAFYDPALSYDPMFSSLHQQAEIYLNFLGLTVSYQSPFNPLPTDAEMEDYRGVITWFERPSVILQSRQYCTWLTHQMKAGRQVVLLGETGFARRTSRTMPEECLETMRTLGLEYGENYDENSYFLDVVKKDSSMVEYQRPLVLTDKLPYSLYAPVASAGGKTYLSISRRDLEDTPSSLVFISKAGAFVHQGYVQYQLQGSKSLWRINPIKFFEEAFHTQDLPKPDVTTINGKRVFFSHIDGDGFLNVSNIDRESYSGAVIINEILKKYATVPVAASIITGYNDQLRFRSAKISGLYADLFKLPNVDPTSHGYAHPLRWRSGKLALDISGYEFDAKKEIVGAAQDIQKILDANKIDKKVRVTTWTGDCRPTEAMIKMARDAGFLNINGGGARLDEKFDSQDYTYPFPLGILRGKELQVYTAQQNENIFTNLWKGPYYGFANVIDTFKNTESPVRLKPINIYYHFYSGERLAALNALKSIYEYSLGQDIIAVTLQDYIRSVNDYYESTIYSKDDGFKVLTPGSRLLTVRFDNPKQKFVDMSRSKGVLGFNWYQDSLYVSLDQSGEHEIYFSSNKQLKPYVIQSSFMIGNFLAEDSTRVSFEKHGWYKSGIILGGMNANKKYAVVDENGSQTLVADGEGVLRLDFKTAENSSPPQSVEIQLESLSQ